MQWADVFRICIYATLLVAIVLIREPCAEGVGASFNALVGAEPSAADAEAPLADDGVEYIRLTEEEIQKRFGADAPAPAVPETKPSLSP